MVTTKQDLVRQRSEQMFSLIQEWESSQQSQKAFYTQRGIKPHIFWYWLRRYREQKHSPKRAAKGFIALEVKEGSKVEALAEIIYSDGTRLVFKERVGLEFLQGLLPKV